MNSLFLAALLPCLSLASANAQAPAITDTPKPIQELATGIQGKSSQEIEKAVIERFGKATRNIGSGLKIFQWDVPGGALTLHPFRGPTFVDQKTKKAFHLLRSENPAKSALLSGYEMTTVADPANHGNRNWIGNLTFGADSSYQYAPGGEERARRDGQSENFFILNPRGTVEVRYAAPVTAETRLETLAEGATVARLIFTSADKAQTATFAIKSHEQERTLTFSGEKALSFEMQTAWKDFGQARSTGHE